MLVKRLRRFLRLDLEKKPFILPLIPLLLPDQLGALYKEGFVVGNGAL